MIPFPIFRRAKIACMIAYFNSDSLTGLLYHTCQKNANILLKFLHIFQKFYLPVEIPIRQAVNSGYMRRLQHAGHPAKSAGRATNWDLAGQSLPLWGRWHGEAVTEEGSTHLPKGMQLGEMVPQPHQSNIRDF